MIVAFALNVSDLIYTSTPMRLLTGQLLSPRCGLCESASAIGVQDLLVEEDATWTSQQEYSRCHISVGTRTTSGVAHAGLDTALVVLVGSASGHLYRVSSTFTKVFSDLEFTYLTWEHTRCNGVDADLGARKRRGQHTAQVRSSRLARRVGELAAAASLHVS